MSWEESNRSQKLENERMAKNARKDAQDAYGEDQAMIERRKMHPAEHRRIERESEHFGKDRGFHREDMHKAAEELRMEGEGSHDPMYESSKKNK